MHCRGAAKLRAARVTASLVDGSCVADERRCGRVARSRSATPSGPGKSRGE